MPHQIRTVLIVICVYSKTILNEEIETNHIEKNRSELSSWDVSHPQNPEEFGEYFEGDIFTPNAGRNGIVGEAKRWTKGVVPYDISRYFSSKDKNVIKTAMDIYHKYTCISFRPRTKTDQDYITITNYQSGCWSTVGKKGGAQEVNLQSPQCTTKIGTPLHELMHVVGFLHEQNRHERDDYVTVNWKNIKEGKEKNFKKAEEGDAEAYGISYDFVSVMHYSSTAFSSNGKRTISPNDNDKLEKMGQRQGFSKGDITKINAMYNCPEKTKQLNLTGEITTETAGSSTDTDTDGSNPFLQAANSLFSIFVKKLRS